MDQLQPKKMKYMRSGILAVCSFIIIAGSFILEDKAAFYNTSVLHDIQKAPHEVLIDDNRILRRDAAAEVEVQGKYNDVEIKLRAGKIWLNTINSGYTTRVLLGEYTVIVPPAIVSLEYIDGKSTIEVLRRIVYVSIGANKRYISQNNGAQFYDTTIKNYSKELGQIHISKFFKEFPLYALTTNKPWYTENSRADEKLHALLIAQFTNAIRQRGPRISSVDGSFIDSLSSIKLALTRAITIDSEKRSAASFANAQRYFDTALYYLHIGSSAEAHNMLTLFEGSMTPIVNDTNFSLLVLDDSLGISEFGDAYFRAREVLNELINEGPMEELMVQLSSVYDSAFLAPSPEQKELLIAAMNQLSAKIEKNAASLSEKESLYLADVLHLFIQSSATLMRDSYYRALSLLQDAALAQASSRESKIDTQQFFLAQKLEALIVLKNKLDSGDIDFQQARKAMLFVAQTIELIKPLLTQSAFLPYFEEKYKLIQPFIAFLRSTETESLRGSFTDEYRQYSEKIRDANYIQSLLNTATGGENLSSLEREQLASITAQDLASTGLRDIQLAFDSNQNSSLIIISRALFDGVSFSARYDTIRKIFTNVFYDEKEIQGGIRLENLSTYLLVSRGKISLAENKSLDSLTQTSGNDEGIKIRTTIENLKKILNDAGTSLDAKYVDTALYDKGTLKILLASRGQEPIQKLFSFEISIDLQTVRNLEVQTVLGQFPVNDEFPFKELALRVDQIFERAIFEKEKNAEVEKLLKSNNNENSL